MVGFLCGFLSAQNAANVQTDTQKVISKARKPIYTQYSVQYHSYLIFSPNLVDEVSLPLWWFCVFQLFLFKDEKRTYASHSLLYPFSKRGFFSCSLYSKTSPPLSGGFCNLGAHTFTSCFLCENQVGIFQSFTFTAIYNLLDVEQNGWEGVVESLIKEEVDVLCVCFVFLFL